MVDNIEVVLSLPADLVSRAKEAGMLDDAHIARLLEAELQRQQRQAAASQLQADLKKLRAASDPLSDGEITALVNDEIEAHRTANR